MFDLSFCRPSFCLNLLIGRLTNQYRSFQIQHYRLIFYIAEDINAIATTGVGEHSNDARQARQDVYTRLENLATKGALAQKILATLRGFTQL